MRSGAAYFAARRGPAQVASVRSAGRAARGSRKRTSAFCGWTLTSTSSGGRVEEEDKGRRFVAPPLLAHRTVEGGVEQPVAHQPAVHNSENPPSPARRGPGRTDEAVGNRSELATPARRHPGSRPAARRTRGQTPRRSARARRSVWNSAPNAWAAVSNSVRPSCTDGEPHLRPGQGVALDHLEAAPQLGLCRLQKLASRRDVEEERRRRRSSCRGCGRPARPTGSRPPSISTRVPSPGAVAVLSSTFATAAIVASASPRNPRVATRSRSAIEAILLVAWRSKASSASSGPSRSRRRRSGCAAARPPRCRSRAASRRRRARSRPAP